jgi:hypothetical protein
MSGTAAAIRGRVSAFAGFVASRRPAPVQVAQAWTGLLLGALVPVLVVLPIGAVPRFLAVLAFACFGLGASVVCQLRLGDPVAAWALALVLGIAGYAYGAVVMAWTRLWYPLAGLIVLAVFAVASGLIALWPTWHPVAPDDSSPWRGPARRTRWPAGGGLDSTMVMAAVTDDSAVNTTMVIPVVMDGPSDATMVMPALVDDGPQAAALTQVIPQVPAVWPEPATLSDAWPDPAGPSMNAGSSNGPFGWPAARPTLRHLGWLAGDDVVTSPSDRPQIVDPPLQPAYAPEPEPVPAATARERRGRRPADLSRLTAQAALAGGSGRSLALALGAIVCAIGLWLFGLARSSTAGVDDYGLLFVLHPAFFAGLAVCLGGFVWELARVKPRGWIIACHIVVVVLILHATVPLLVYEPEYAWTYTHLGVIDYIRVHGSVQNSTDIYQQWPTFFATVAQMVSVSGLNDLRVAAWAPVFFDMANCLPLFAIARTLSTNPRVPYLTVMLFSCINWIGQDYLSPQAFAYLLYFGILLILLRWLRRVPGRAEHRFKLVRRAWTWTQSGLAGVPYVANRARRSAQIALYGVYIVITASHQISPYFIAAAATGLVVLGLVKGWQIIPMFGVIAATYLLPRYHVVESYGLFDGFSFFSNSKGNGPATIVTPGELFSHQVVQALALTTWAATALILFAQRRRLGPLAVPAVLAFSPMVILLGQSYGGEAIYRVYLFSSPWCAYIIASTILRGRLRMLAVRLVAGVAGTVALALVALASMQGEHGQLVFDQFSREEVDAAEYVYDHVPDNCILAYATQNFPNRPNASYARINIGYGQTPKVLPDEVTIGPKMDESDLAAIDSYFLRFGSLKSYLVVSPSMERYTTYFGYLPVGTMARLDQQLAMSPNWRLWYSHGSVHVYEFLATRAS